MIFKKLFNIKSLLLLSVIALSLTAVTKVSNKSVSTNPVNNDPKSASLETQIDEKITPIIEDETPTPTEISAKITAVGDILYHGEQLSSAYNSTTGEYVFNNNFNYVKNYISDADFSLATCETTFAGEEYEYSAYPLFNTPSEALIDLKNTGFDMLSLATNHLLDVTEPGFFNSISAVEAENFDILGVRENESIKNYTVKDINGIKIGFTSYCFETASNYGQRTINGIPIPNSLLNLINSFSAETLDSDLLSMNQTVENMKTDGAEFIIFVMHWGDEYFTEYSNTQKEIAEALNSYGVDVILGSHPHVVQPLEKIVNEKNQKETVVFYSLGNFLSNQRLETMGNALSANGAIAQLEIIKSDDGTVSLKSYNYIPTWVYKYTDSDNIVRHQVLPIEDVLNGSLSIEIPSDILSDIEASYSSTTSIIGQVK